MQYWLRWQKGRQQSGYDKMLLVATRLPFVWLRGFDAYLLRFPVGSHIPPHRDVVESGRHYRLNIVLHLARKGGVFSCSDSLFESKRIKLFRPDIAEHAVSEVEAGTRLLLSVGWVRGSNTSS